MSRFSVFILIFASVMFLAASAVAQQNPAPVATTPAATSAAPATPVQSSNDAAQKAGATSASTNDPDQKPAAEKPPAGTQSPEATVPTTTVYPEPKQQQYLAPELVPEPLPKNKVALIGGVVKSIDQVRNRMTLQIFGAKKMNLIFDGRTHFDRNGVETNQLAVKTGDRVYVDTQLANGKIFARNVHLRTAEGIASASGQVIAYYPKTGEVSMRDNISKRPVNFRVTQSTVIKTKDADGTPALLQPNALISVRLNAAAGSRSVANEIDVLASPGAQFTFYGTLSHLDLRSGMLAVDNKSDNRIYDIRFVPAQIGMTDALTIGADVAVVATFNGENYTAKSVTVNQAAKAANPE
ncbi:MAG: hypothetical protein JWN45_754 [Acidobacteriaceae bacterium]|nr:hypothetical protein [Acidobacteriaceae bacterium]